MIADLAIRATTFQMYFSLLRSMFEKRVCCSTASQKYFDFPFSIDMNFLVTHSTGWTHCSYHYRDESVIHTTSYLLYLGHHLDQKRLKQGLYRHPWDDISYILPESAERPAGYE